MSTFNFNKSANENSLQRLTKNARGVQDAVADKSGATMETSNFSSLFDSLELIAELQQNAIFVSNCFSKDRVIYNQALQTVYRVEAVNSKYAKMFKE